MKYIILFACILFSITLSAQNCTDESLIQRQGILTPDAPYNSGKFSAVDLAKHKKVVATITNMIKLKYAPMGLKALYHEAYGYPIPYWPVNDYGYSIIPLNFYCDGNTIKTAHETSTYFQISANIFNATIFESPNIEEATSGSTGFHYLQDMPVEKDGYWYFKEKDVTLAFGIPGKVSGWLITYDGKLPFAYVTKKEFLEVQKKLVAKGMLALASHFREVLADNDISKKNKEIEFKNDPEKLKKYMKMDYLSTKERYEKLLGDNDKSYKPAFDKIDKQLKLPAAELNEQAIVKHDPYDHLSFLFTDDNDPFGEVLIKPNPAYFKKLPKSSPQFFSVFLTGSHKDPIAAKFMTDIMKAVDFTTLKNMLGK